MISIVSITVATEFNECITIPRSEKEGKRIESIVRRKSFERIVRIEIEKAKRMMKSNTACECASCTRSLARSAGISKEKGKIENKHLTPLFFVDANEYLAARHDACGD